MALLAAGAVGWVAAASSLQLFGPPVPPPFPSVAALEEGVGRRLAAHPPDGARRVLVLLLRGEAGVPAAVSDLALPPWAAARPLRVEGPASPRMAWFALTRGFDPVRGAPLGPREPTLPDLPGWLEGFVRGGAALHLWVPEEAIPAAGRGSVAGQGGVTGWFPRTMDLLEPGSGDGTSHELAVLGRLAARAAQPDPWAGPAYLPPKPSLWVAWLEPPREGPTPTRALTEALVATTEAFLGGGLPGRSMVLILHVPREGPAGTLRRTRRGFMAGPIFPDLSPAELELEEVAPSLAALVGVPEPGGGRGAPRLDLLASRDPRGGVGTLLGGFEEAADRVGHLAEAVDGRGIEFPDLSMASKLYQAGGFHEARDLLVRERRKLARTLEVRARDRYRAGRAGRYRVTYTLLALAGVSLLAGFLLGWGRGALAAAGLGFALQAGLLALLRAHNAARLDELWLALCAAPTAYWQAGLATSALAAVPGVVLGAAGRVRPAGGSAAFLLVAAPWVFLLGVHHFQVGPGVPPVPVPTEALLTGYFVSATTTWLGAGFVLVEVVATLRHAVAPRGPAGPPA